jgi:peroxiredoxin Q/BCP
MLKEGEQAPDFSLRDKDSNIHSLSEINSDHVVIYFYPKDSTPGCTIEAQEFSKDIEEFDKLNIRIIGISGGDEKSKTKFCEKHDLKILLLSDSDFSVSNNYGVYGEKSFMGRKYMGISRWTFVLNKDHKIIKIYDKVKPELHSQEVLEFIKEN